VLQAAAFGVFESATSTEEIVLFVATRVSLADEREALIESCRRRVMERLGVAIREVRLTGPYAIPKTTSGKVRRSECRRLYLESNGVSHESRNDSPTAA
jgi:acyl-coenzyme A synthetase/AMP-(fatty) acid ligase